MSKLGVTSKVSQDADESNLSRLKKRLAWACAAELVPMSADSRTQMSDTERERRLIEELDRVIGRIKDARHDYGKADVVFATNLPPATTETFICRRCGNRNPDLIYADPRTGDTICRGATGDDNCGEVIQDHRVDRGAAKRNFADAEEDRNHHGPIGNIYMPDSVNLRTTFDTLSRGAGGRNGDKLAKISQAVEMGISNLGHDQRASTRTGYKTNQKNEAFRQMMDWGVALQIHDAVIEKAKAEFAKFREVRERVERFTATVAGCIILSYQELEGKMTLEKKVYNEIHERSGLTGGKLSYNTAATAGGGGGDTEDKARTFLAEKRMAAWTIDDAKQWLTAVSTNTSHKGTTAIAAKAAAKIYASSIGEEAMAAVAAAAAATKNASATTNAKPKPAIFNTTTIKGRASGGGNGDKAPSNAGTSGGQALLSLRPRLEKILNKSIPNGKLNASTAHFFREAIDRRVMQEDAARKQTRLAEMELARSRTETEMNTKGVAKAQKIASISGSSSARDREKPATITGVGVQSPISSSHAASKEVKVEAKQEEEEEGVDDDFDLEDLLGVTPSLEDGSFDNKNMTSNAGAGGNGGKRKACQMGRDEEGLEEEGGMGSNGKRIKKEPEAAPVTITFG